MQHALCQLRFLASKSKSIHRVQIRIRTIFDQAARSRGWFTFFLFIWCDLLGLTNSFDVDIAVEWDASLRKLTIGYRGACSRETSLDNNGGCMDLVRKIASLALVGRSQWFWSLNFGHLSLALLLPIITHVLKIRSKDALLRKVRYLDMTPLILRDSWSSFTHDCMVVSYLLMFVSIGRFRAPLCHTPWT